MSISESSVSDPGVRRLDAFMRVAQNLQSVFGDCCEVASLLLSSAASRSSFRHQAESMTKNAYMNPSPLTPGTFNLEDCDGQTSGNQAAGEIVHRNTEGLLVT